MSIAPQMKRVADNNSRRPTAPGMRPYCSVSLRGLLAPGYWCTRGLLTAAIIIFFSAAMVRAETPLYEEEPYDQITLNAANGSEVLKVKPITDPSIRRYLDRPKPDGKLVVRLVTAPDKEYELKWRKVAKVELFEQLVLEKANEVVDEGRFNEAYDYFAFLQKNRPGMPGLAKAGEDFLFAEANAAYHKEQYDGALALLRELYRRNPKRAGIDRVLGGTTDKLVEQSISERNFPAAQVLLHNLALWFPDHAVVAKWTGQWRAEATPLLAEGRQAAESGQWTKAAALSRQVTALCPEMPGARELAETVHRKYSRLVVGVTAPATDFTVSRLDDWASRRSRARVPHVDRVCRPQHRRGQVRLPGGRGAGRQGPRPPADHAPEARHPLERGQGHLDRRQRGAAVVGHRRPEQFRLPDRLVGPDAVRLGPRGLRGGRGVAPVPRPSRGDAANHLDAAWGDARGRPAAADQRPDGAPVAQAAGDRLRPQPPVFRRRARPADGTRRTPLRHRRPGGCGLEAEQRPSGRTGSIPGRCRPSAPTSTSSSSRTPCRWCIA